MAEVAMTLPADIKEQRLDFTNSQGERLAGVLVNVGPKTILLCHGYKANYDMCQFPALAAGLAAEGISSYRFDHACAWRKDKALSERKGPFLFGNHEQEAQDMKDAYDFLTSQGKNVCCILGHSKGGINVILYASKHDAPTKIIFLSGRFSVLDGLKQRFGDDILEKLAKEKTIPRVDSGMKWDMTEEDFNNRANIPMEKLAKSIPATTTVLCMHGTEDKTIPWQEGEKCASFIENSLFVTIDGADHNYSRTEDAKQMIEQVIQFVLD